MSHPSATRETIVYEGFLKKKSPKAILGLHPWQDRYFVIWPHQICYYKKKEEVCDDEKSLGFLMVENIKGAEALPEKGPGRFNILLEGAQRMFELQADSAENCQAWITAVQDIIKRYGKKPVALVANASGEDAKFWKPVIHKKLMQRRQAIIISEPVTPTDLKALAPSKFEKTPEVFELIYQTVANNMAFQIMDEAERREVVNEMWSVDYSKKDKLISEGDPMRLFYVIIKGSFDMISSVAPEDNEGRSTKTSLLKAGDAFGELALLYDSTSTHTVVAREDSQCYAFDRAHYKKMIAASSEKHFAQRMTFLRNSPIFGNLDESLLKKMAEALEQKTFKSGEVIIRQDDPVDAFYILLTGQAMAVRDGKEVNRYQSPGDYFGERALIKNDQRGVTVHALSSVTLLYLTRRDFVSLMGTVKETVENGYRKFSVLGSQVALVTEPVSPSDAGSSAQEQTPEEAAATKNVGGINLHFGGEESKQVGGAAAERVCPVKSLAELEIIGTLGRGTFGHVQLVADKAQKTYALKAVNKCHIVRHNQILHILNERAVMMTLNHPFVVHLYGTLRDKNYLYFLLEPSLGGELFSVLRARDKFDSDTARFYAAIVVSVFQYMHSLDILYRDLKPENLLMDSDGYLRVTDFGFAKQTKDRTYTFCGTPDYLAPEIVASAGHHVGADWWTLGILIFEMLAGYTPFYDEAGPTSMYSKILGGKLYFPAFFTQAEQDLISSLLQTKPTRRLGVTLGGAEVIKKHAWFEKIDWNALLERKINAPIKNPIKNARDLSNFDQYPEDPAPTEEFVVDPANPDWDSVF